ncbi:MAG: hypothetical protein ACI8PZ_001430 [Myxococcota bacterium]|jgi:hypothetical protein
MIVIASISTALAGVPVVHEGGDPGAAIAAASERSGLPADQLTAVAVSGLLSSPPTAVGDTVVRRCARGPARMTDVSVELVRAEAALGSSDAVRTLDHLDLAVAQLGCLTEVADADRVALGFLLRGAMAAELGEPEAARGEIRTALAFDADVDWPPGYPVAGQALLAEELSGTERHQVRVVPDDTGAGPWVDGREVEGEVSLTPGLHLVQYGSKRGLQTAWLVVDGASALVVPDRFGPPVLDAFLEPATRADVALLLAATLPNFEAAYVAHRGGLWLVVSADGGASVEELVPGEPLPVPEVEPTGKKGKKRR